MIATASLVRPLVEELHPYPDPWSVARRLAHLPHLAFLDSAETHATRGRYSYLAADPLHTWRIDERAPNFLHDEHAALPTEFHAHADLPPFQGGIIGLFGYGLAHSLEAIPRPRFDEFRTPARFAGLYDWVISFDQANRRAWLVSTGWQPSGELDESAARQRLRRVKLALQTHPHDLPHTNAARTPIRAPQFALPGQANVTSNFSREGYLHAVQRAIDYIHAGDCFQVNLSQRLLTPLTEHPLALYERLRTVSPAPFACYLDLGEQQLVSASPERFLLVNAAGDISTRPIKGTRPRGRTVSEDAELLRDLTTNPKDRAENIMIVDLLRNDIGRVAAFGSMHVPKVCEVETYPYVHHLVSEVRGRLRHEATVFDLMHAAFPGGSVTGAPKVRAMEIISELEPTARGAYCGSVGYIGFDGAMDTNILIRTFTAAGGWLQFPVGGGIVADSQPELEYEETLHKAAGMLRALSV
jgi:para-aminobenzoate synthetase component I